MSAGNHKCLSFSPFKMNGNSFISIQSLPCPSDSNNYKKGTPPLKSSRKCPHGHRKYTCRECKGSQICQHDKRRERCKECKGSQICPHNQVKARCKECKGIQICQHSRRKEYCKDCKGVQICPHDRVKASCRDCKGSYFCPHNRARSVCKDCKGSGICQHGRSRQFCKECKGSRICPEECPNYGNFKSLCASCGGSQLCQLCRITSLGRGRKVCASCLPVPFQASRSKEVRLAAKLNKWVNEDKIPAYTRWNKQNPLADPFQCGKYRVDFTFERPTKVVLLECDERQHSEYNRRCELVRQAQVSVAFGGLPVHWIRYNPDTFRLNGVTHVVTAQERESILLKQLQLAFHQTDFEHLLTITYICYTRPSAADGELHETLKFKTIEEYIAWTESTTKGPINI